MGRDRRNEQRFGQFAPLLHGTMDTPAWRALTPTAQALYPWLRLQWRGGKFNNNGSIRLSVRQAAECMGVGKNAAARAFQDLQAKGFIHQRKHAQLGIEGEGKAPEYEITDVPYGEDRGGRKLFLKWSKGNDFPVPLALRNNPRGRNGKTKPCHQKGDGPVPKLVTIKGGKA